MLFQKIAFLWSVGPKEKVLIIILAICCLILVKLILPAVFCWVKDIIIELFRDIWCVSWAKHWLMSSEKKEIRSLWFEPVHMEPDLPSGKEKEYTVGAKVSFEEFRKLYAQNPKRYDLFAFCFRCVDIPDMVYIFGSYRDAARFRAFRESEASRIIVEKIEHYQAELEIAESKARELLFRNSSDEIKP